MGSLVFFILVYQGLYLVPPIRHLTVGSLSYIAFSLNVVVWVAGGRVGFFGGFERGLSPLFVTFILRDFVFFLVIFLSDKSLLGSDLSSEAR